MSYSTKVTLMSARFSMPSHQTGCAEMVKNIVLKSFKEDDFLTGKTMSCFFYFLDGYFVVEAVPDENKPNGFSVMDNCLVNALDWLSGENTEAKKTAMLFEKQNIIDQLNDSKHDPVTSILLEWCADGLQFVKFVDHSIEVLNYSQPCVCRD